jgi:hypothetical protein
VATARKNPVEEDVDMNLRQAAEMPGTFPYGTVHCKDLLESTDARVVVYLRLPRPETRGGSMDRDLQPEIYCSICNLPLTLLPPDTCADENGNAVHSDCYVKSIAANNPPASIVAA